MPRPVAYLVSQYPATSHTFIHREVRALRRTGRTVLTFSVRPPDAAERLAPEDAAELATTTVLLAGGAGRRFVDLLPSVLRQLGPLLRVLPAAVARGRSFKGAAMQVFYLLEAVVVFDRARRHGVRHVHAHFANNAADVARSAAALGRARGEAWTWSFTMHGPTEFSDVRATGLASKAAEADLVVCISDYARSQVMALTPHEGWDRLAVVRCGLELDRWPHQARPLRAGPVQVVCVGRLVPVKGQSVLLEALALLRDAGTPVDVVFVGDGPDRTLLEDLARSLDLGERVTFTGAVGVDRVRDLMAQADVFCLPSFQEGLPVVLMEALASGLPVVTTRIMGTPELVEDAVTGLLVTPGRADEVAAALRRLAEDPGLRVRLAEAGRRRVVERHDVEVEAGRLDRLFAAVSDQTGAPDGRAARPTS